MAWILPHGWRRDQEVVMRHNRAESRTTAAAAIILLAAISAIAEEKRKSVEALILKEESRPVRRIVVSIQDRKLALVEEDRVIKIWSTAVGAESTPSPNGIYTVVNRLSKPTYYKPGKVVPPGPSNPLGTRWLGLSLKGFGIHGTNAPGSIGRKASHGCIRMRNRDIEELFNLVEVGIVVELYSESDPYLAQIFAAAIQPASLTAKNASAALSFNYRNAKLAE
jgi:lipoprotein-anchoring transpeptidase ErfK/SrfK